MDTVPKISYISSDSIICPSCENSLHREELHSRGGRIVTDTRTQELRHTYKPSDKYGIVTPLLYSITVCPRCRYSAFKNDFARVDQETASDIKRTQNIRMATLTDIFPHVDFTGPREMAEGIVSYHYALLCYQYWPVVAGPVIKQGMAALRIAWLCSDLNGIEPENNWDAVARVFYRKARYFYRLAWERDDSREEVLPADFSLGPDSDENYGVDGVRYLASYLEFRWGNNQNIDIRRKNLERIREQLSYFFSTGNNRKAASAILTNARNLHAAAGEELKKE